MKRSLIYQYIMLQCAVLVMCESYYSIIAPGVMKSNRKYTIAVSLYDATEPCTMRIAIEGPSFNAAEEVFVRPFQSKLVDFLPPKLLEGDYKLIAEGLSGLQFKNESKLYVDIWSGPKIYIQTDKAVYKPQDLVQFRVVILDEHTRPLNIREPVRVEILDDLDNRVKQFKDIVLTKGVYTGKFQLSEHPVLETWKIKVIIGGKYAYSDLKTFIVKKYVLPKFSVYLKTPEDFVLEDGFIKAVIYGKYTFQKYVEGNATIEIWDTHSPNNYKLLQQKKLDIESVGSVEFHTKNHEEYEKLYGVTLKAKLTEKFTGITQEEHTYIIIRKTRYDIHIPNDEIEFQNNKPYRLKANVKYWSGAAVIDRETPVLMDHGDKRYEAYLDENGVATFDFEHQPDTNHVVTYKDAKYVLPSIFTNQNFMLNNTEYYCRLKVLGEGVPLVIANEKGEPPLIFLFYCFYISGKMRLRVGSPFKIEVSSIAAIPYLVYTIVGHGSLIRLEHITVPPNQKTYTIEIIPSIEMVPHAFIYVHYIQNGNLRYEEMELKFPFEFENQVSIMAPKQVRPGQEVTIDITAQPKSYVSIMAVDLSVCLLDCSYDLDKHRILDDLNYDLTYIPVLASVYPGLISGVITLTNANYPFTDAGLQPQVKSAASIPLRFRNKFPETWIYENLEITKPNTQFTLNIPDTITTWRITAFSNNAITGFGIVDGPTDITTIQPFFISLNLPYSIKRGEIVNIPITLFNYFNQSLDTEVIMFNNDDEFYFMESTIQDAEKSEDNEQQIKHINVPSNGGNTLTFLINPKQVGDINLRISATNSLYSDAVHQKLKVEPEGVAKRFNQAIYLSVPEGEVITSSFSLEIPDDSVPDSEYITISAGGDYLIPTLDNLNDLVQMPTGCGEQNMVNFAPNLLILQYLKATGRFAKEQELVKKIKSFMDIGYQQQLSFRHKNGGYSVFGEKTDGEVSNWLTAYVLRFFIKASKYSSIEARIIDSGLDYLTKQQNSNGEFPHTGYLFNSAHQNKYGFTAFVLLTFLEDRKYATKYQNTIQNGLQFINSHLDDITDIYTLSIIATALKAAKHNNANRVIDKLKSLSMEDEKGLIWWSGNDKDQIKDVEITAYVLMALLDTPGDHLPILKWLLEQRNAQGGFKSTHDTVVGLQALVKFSEKYGNLDEMDLKITYCAKDLEGNELRNDEFSIKAYNTLVFQKHELPKSTRYVSFILTGIGYSLLQLSHQYNVIDDQQFKHFLIKPKAKVVNLYQINLEICFSYQSEPGSLSNVTNMVIMETNLPSGYRSDAEFDLIDNELVQKIESKNDESTIVLYFDNLFRNDKHCLSIAADKITDVIRPKPAAIIMYDYYNISRANTEFYNIVM